jgi:hypothetical protein
MRKIFLGLAFLSALAAGPGWAGGMADFEIAMRSAYTDYRVALFATNTGKADVAAQALSKFTAAWTALANGNTPPQYEDDADYANTMRAVSDIAAKASDAITAGKLPEAHETLEEIRDQIEDLHARAGLYTISDRMNAYHARMEKVIANPDMDANTAREEAAVLDYLADDIIAHPPAGADPSFSTLCADLKSSIDALKAAAVDGDANTIKAAIGGLKAPYSKLFVKYG